MKRTVPVLLLFLLAVAPAQGATLLRLDGVGPLKVCASRPSALATDWLSNRHSGCKLGGKPYPIDYDLPGAKAPAGLDGSAEFIGGKLVSLTFTKGVRTATGVLPRITSWPSMVKRYRDAGFKVLARYDETFAGTFVTVKRRKGGDLVMTGFAEKGKAVGTLGVPFIPLCE